LVGGPDYRERVRLELSARLDRLAERLPERPPEAEHVLLPRRREDARRAQQRLVLTPQQRGRQHEHRYGGHDSRQGPTPDAFQQRRRHRRQKARHRHVQPRVPPLPFQQDAEQHEGERRNQPRDQQQPPPSHPQQNRRQDKRQRQVNRRPRLTLALRRIEHLELQAQIGRARSAQRDADRRMQP